jgi:hypothetical protein
MIIGVLAIIRVISLLSDFAYQDSSAINQETVSTISPANTDFSIGNSVTVDRGDYLVGKDIPAGTYDVSYNNSFCILEVYLNNGENYSDIQEMISEDAPKYRNLKLVDGYRVVIGNGDSLIFKKTK